MIRCNLPEFAVYQDFDFETEIRTHHIQLIRSVIEAALFLSVAIWLRRTQ